MVRSTRLKGERIRTGRNLRPEDKGDRKLEVINCGLKKTTLFSWLPEPIGTGIDDHSAMGNDLKTQNAISKPPFRAKDISGWILTIRGHRVMLDADLAKLYGVMTGALNQAVKRNKGRFPEDFAFRLTAKEKEEVVTKCDNLARLKFSPVLPLAFTEHGAIMAASVLNSQRGIKTSVYVVRAFVRMREALAGHRDLAKHLTELERKYDAQFRMVFDAIRALPGWKRAGLRPGIPKI